MSNWLCRIKKSNGRLTEREQRKLSEEFRNLALAYDLEYIIVTRND